MSAVLAIDDLHVTYGKRTVLDGVSFEVEAGSVFALLGRNGAGKSSLVRCALGLQRAARGRTRLFGDDAWRHRARALARVGVVPEEPDAPPQMTARELLRFCGRFYPAWDAAGGEARLRRLETPLDVAFGRLSKGQKSAVMMALGLAHAPALLVLDDPTLGLDAVARRTLYDELIGELADRGTAVFITTHDLSGVEAIAQRVAILRGGRLAVNEDLDTLKARYRRVRCAGAMPASAWAPFEVAATVERDWGREAIVTNFDEERLQEFRSRGAGDVEVGGLSLEEVFLSVSAKPEPAANGTVSS